MNEVRILARFISPDGPALYPRMTALLWDQDAVADDILAEASLDQDGRVAFQFDLSSASSIDSPGEVMPDLYVEILLDNIEFFRTPVTKDIDFLETNSVTGFKDHTTQDLGTFQLPELGSLGSNSRREFMGAFTDPKTE